MIKFDKLFCFVVNYIENSVVMLKEKNKYSIKGLLNQVGF